MIRVQLLAAVILSTSLKLGFARLDRATTIYKIPTHRAHRDGLLKLSEDLREVTEIANVDLFRRLDIVKKERADPTHLHEVIFEIAHDRDFELEKIALDVSDPDSLNYGKHWTRQQIADFLDCYGSQKATASYLTSQEIEIVGQSPWGDEITAKAPIAVWEQVFSTTFHNFEQRHPKSSTRRKKGVVPETFVSGFVRAMQYTLPAELEEHVEAAFNTVQFTPRSVHGAHITTLPEDGRSANKYEGTESRVEVEDADDSGKRSLLASGYTGIYQGYITPSVLNKYYGITSNTGSTLTSQAVYETNGQTLSPESLQQFLNNYGLPQASVSKIVNGHVDSAACVAGSSTPCSEANANVEYIMGMSQRTPTTYWYDSIGDMRMWINSVARSPNPPKLFSITYIVTETDLIAAVGTAKMLSSYVTSFDRAAVILAVQGVTLVIGTGDDGAAGYNAMYEGEAACQYNADFPATSPYVTAVGTTVGPESNLTEVACSGKTGTVSSGGGFSLIYSQPAWQKDAISDYFATAAAKGVSPAPGYDTSARGVPDVSGAGNVYIVVNKGNFEALAGSSLSAPFVASVISLGNAARRRNGLPTFGWLNPALYKNTSAAIFRDVTSGSNECTAYGQVCCSQGFTAVEGWDPVTGWGSIDFKKFKVALFTAKLNNDSLELAAGTLSIRRAPDPSTFTLESASRSHVESVTRRDEDSTSMPTITESPARESARPQFHFKQGLKLMAPSATLSVVEYGLIFLGLLLVAAIFIFIVPMRFGKALLPSSHELASVPPANVESSVLDLEAEVESGLCGMNTQVQIDSSTVFPVHCFACNAATASAHFTMRSYDCDDYDLNPSLIAA